jgi:sugar transferase (PEP-CTERM/EpsH1 system associated)
MAPMDVLLLSHCVPNPPDKGERIRVHHVARYLAARCRLHVACYARAEEEREAARQMEPWCASVYCERLRKWGALAGGLARWATGASLTQSYYGSARLKAEAAALAGRLRPAATVVYSAAMAPLAPPGAPVVLDMVDVDSQKWLEYARTRRPGFVYAIEGRRLRRAEVEAARRASRTLLCTGQELALFRSFAPEVSSECIENGVDLDYFDPAQVAPLAEGAGKRVLVFTGVMDYFPNSEGACRFVREVFGELRRRQPDLEFWIVGRNPSAAVRALGGEAGVRVTGGVADIRPYLRTAHAVVAPLRIARGIQNKVLEALSMGRRVLASTAVCATFGGELPPGVEPAESLEAVERALAAPGPGAERIREAARRRFHWEGNLERFWQAVSAAAGRC